jgi:hypothetical protein
MKINNKMKKIRIIVYLAIISIISFGALLYSCVKENPKQVERIVIPNEVLSEVCATCESYAFWLPERTKIEKVESKDGNQIIFTAPEGYAYYGYTTDSSLIIWDNKSQGRSSVSVTCDCTNGNDDNCSPVGHNGEITCVIQTGCTSCDRIEKAKNDDTKIEYEILHGGFVNPSMGISFAQVDEDIPYAFEALLAYPEVQEQFETFMLQFYNNMEDIPAAIDNGVFFSAPEGYRFTVLNIYGRALVVLLPERKSINDVGGSTYSCPCNGTSGECDTKKTWSPMGYFYSCKKDSSNPCNQACNTMTIEDDKKKRVYTYTYYYF